jgi:poly-gamma-glutamate biosynthesis protein PgsC/CapC
LVLQSVGLGLVISLIFSEMFGLAAGGLVVPGYIALYLERPLALAATIVASLITIGLIRFLSYFMFIFGRRRMVLTILIGFVAGWAFRSVHSFNVAGFPLDLAPVGFIIPGLIANWMDRQGVLPTLATMIIAAVLVRLLLIILSGGAFFSMEEVIG